MASPAVQSLAARARNALAGQPAIGGNLCADFGSDGCVFIYANNSVAVLNSPDKADCTISMSLAEEQALEAGASVEWAVVLGKVEIAGNEDLAKKFGAIVQSEKAA